MLMPVHLLFPWLKASLAQPAAAHLAQGWRSGRSGIRVDRARHADEQHRPLMVAVQPRRPGSIFSCSLRSLDVTFVAKAEVRGWPVFGIACPPAALDLHRSREDRRKTQRPGQRHGITGSIAGEIGACCFRKARRPTATGLRRIKSSLLAARPRAAEFKTGMVHVQPVAVAYTKVHGIAMGHLSPADRRTWPGRCGAVAASDAACCGEGAMDVEVAFGAPI